MFPISVLAFVEASDPSPHAGRVEGFASLVPRYQGWDLVFPHLPTTRPPLSLLVVLCVIDMKLTV